jgi:protein gp37
MGANSKIEWTHHTFNPWWGCVEMSPACDHCYARTFSKRLGYDIWGTDKPRRWASPSYWRQPLKWNLAAAKASERRRVFCASMADVFEKGSSDLDGQRSNLWALIESTPMLDWLLLTKRPENITRMVPTAWLETPRFNVWYGTTVEDNPRTARVDRLRQVPADVRFLSCEPLLDDIAPALSLEGIHWVICGGESGRGARPMNPEWARGLRDTCEDAGIPFHFKQWGDWFPRSQWEDNPYLLLPDDCDLQPSASLVKYDDGEIMHRVGKKAAGRLLDSFEWNELPTAVTATRTSRVDPVVDSGKD